MCANVPYWREPDWVSDGMEALADMDCEEGDALLERFAFDKDTTDMEQEEEL